MKKHTHLNLSLIVALLVSALISAFQLAMAGSPPPQAPAHISWLPHGYGGSMHIKNTVFTRQKGTHGFRSVPEHTGCWSQPLWGWDVNGFYRGPNCPEPDPAMCQLPIGLIYPENGPPCPPPPQKVKQ